MPTVDQNRRGGGKEKDEGREVDLGENSQTWRPATSKLANLAFLGGGVQKLLSKLPLSIISIYRFLYRRR